MAKSYDLLFKVLLIGDSGVGKTCILCRFANDEFRDTHISTIGIDFKMKTIIVDGKRVRIQMWDTAGQERYETITTQYYRRAQGIILVYDITRLQSFQNIRKWLKYVEENASPTVEKMLLGNKCDVPADKRKVPTELGQRLADEYGLNFYETSAFADINIDEAFSSLSKRLMKSSNGNQNGVETSSAVILDTEKEVYKPATCCGS